MPKIMEIIEKETKGKSYHTYKYSYDSIGLPSIDYDDDPNKIMKWKDSGETGSPKKPIDLNVKLVVMDMSTIYKGLAHRMFPNAEIIADKYHVIRLSSFALENVRKKEQNRFSKEHRKRIKTQKRLLKRSKENLHEEEMCRLANLFEQMPRLGKSYYLHEKFRKIFKAKDLKEAEKLISNWELEASVSKIDEFKDCIKALENWRHEIINIFRYEITNGYTEGCNNKSKVLKRVSYGLMNYERFVKRRMQLWQNI